MKRTIVILLALFCSNAAYNQENDVVRCSTDSVHAQKMEDPEYREKFRKKQDAVEQYLSSREGSRGSCEDPYIIPVAVHFQDVNIDNQCAIDMAVDQVESLNADFSATNTDIDTWNNLQPDIWPEISNSEACIEFCLATLNHPDGYNLSNGDYAVTLNQTDGDNNADWTGYLNFWVRELPGTLGFSPLGGSGNGDGVTCSITAFSSIECGGNTLQAQYNLGRTVTHETGHYLLLEHPWGGGGCMSTDQVDDTPVTDAAQFGCPQGEEIINCDEPILWPTYMEYCDDACLFMFSQGQVDRMQGYVETSLQNLADNATTTCQEVSCSNFEVAVEQTQESCAGNDGMLELTAEGGNAPYQYSINGGSSFQSGGEYNGLTEGPYEIIVADANSCTFVDTIQLQSQDPTIEVVSTEPAFCGDNSGSLEVSVSESFPFEYQVQNVTGWRDSSSFDNLSSGNYTVNVRSGSNCTGSIEVQVGDENDLNSRVTRLQPVNCPYFDNGEVNVAVSAGENVIFTLDNEKTQNSGNFTGLSQGPHSIYISDDRGCEDTIDFNIQRSFLNIDEECPCKMFVPNAITPADANGINDLLRIEASCPVSNFDMQIFDRWGNEVFRTSDIDERWNGGIGQGEGGVFAAPGMYMYVITFRWGEEYNTDIDVQTITGHINVIR